MKFCAKEQNPWILELSHCDNMESFHITRHKVAHDWLDSLVLSQSNTYVYIVAGSVRMSMRGYSSVVEQSAAVR